MGAGDTVRSAGDPPPTTYPGDVQGPTRDTSRMRPPARRVVLAEVTSAPLDVEVHAKAVGDPSAGALVTFAGVVRDHDHGRAVMSIEYLGHPTAGQVLAAVVADVVAGSDVEAVAVSHRLGPLRVGEAAMVVAVAGAHRAEAFEVAHRLVDEVKGRLPVWKRQVFPDGSDEWVGCP